MPSRILMTRPFAKFAKKERVHVRLLIDAVQRAEAGLIDADLGSGIIKQRVARPGGGRSGGYRSIVAFRVGFRSIYVYGFAKNERENLTQTELAALRLLAADLLTASEAAIDKAVKDGNLIEIHGEVNG